MHWLSSWASAATIWATLSLPGLLRVASQYAAKGCRYQGREWEGFDNLNLGRPATWLRWATPDDAWHYGDFPERFAVAPPLASFIESGAFGEDAEELEEFCTQVLARLQSDAGWLAVVGANRVWLE
jgi:hypothetical protein